MSQIISYLNFNGNCREAMTFYQECLGGELIFQTFGDSPLSNKMPQKMKDCILHAMLTKGKIRLMASDVVSEEGLVKGNSIALAITCNSNKEIKQLYSKLSAGSPQNYPLEISFYNTLIGNLTDKFGNHWILSYDKNLKKQPSFEPWYGN